MGKNTYGGAERFLEQSLLFNFVIHGLALLGMVLLLVPFLPGGTTPLDADRITLLAAHPWQFRFGWLPWQLWTNLASGRSPTEILV